MGAALYMRDMEAAGSQFPHIRAHVRMLQTHGETALRAELNKESDAMKSLVGKLGCDMNKLFLRIGVPTYSQKSFQTITSVCASRACVRCAPIASALRLMTRVLKSATGAAGV